jgi:galactokinase
MLPTVTQAFQHHYAGAPSLLIRAPGRINLIGEHTDYNNGFVLPAAVDKYVYFALSTSSESKATIFSLSYDETLRFAPSSPKDSGQTTSAWGQYLLTAVRVMQDKGHKISPFRLAFGGDIPLGAGMSSSAALCCGFIYGLSELFELNLLRPEIALLAQATEHRIGIQCGLMDQYAVLFGQTDRVLFLDCESLQYQHFPLSLGDYTLVLINSMVKHELAAESGYNDRRASCERVVSVIQRDHPSVDSLRHVSMKQLTAHQNVLSDDDYRRARYVLHENQRVQNTVRALQQGNVPRVGELISQSHAGMRDEYQVTVPEVDTLVDLALRQPGVLGARMMGGGFGGCTINLISKDQRDQAIAEIVKPYQQQYGTQPEVYELGLSNGVGRVDIS